MDRWVLAGMAVLAAGGQLANIFLNLKLRAGLLESEKRICAEVAEIYQRADVCEVKMEALRARLC